jgi:hypothetical protein
MVQYTIHTPIWNGGKVGIASHRVAVDTQIEIKLDYRDSNRNLVHPHLYVMDCKKVREYPTQMVKGVKLHLVPISDFRAARRKDEDDPPRET